MNKMVSSYLKETLGQVADALESGHLRKKARIGITTLGSEHGENEIVRGAELASKRNSDIEIIVIGNIVSTYLEVVKVKNEEEAHEVMDKMLENGELDGCVTNHYNFPLGVSTVGRVITPGIGAKMFLGSTTGTSDSNTVVSMVKNTLSAIGVAKACGLSNPSVGILNINGGKQVERALRSLKEGGYEINFSESLRSDGGTIMRGNDLLLGSPNIMICDSLTGNVLMKMFSAYSSGGSYESLGYGYGPGVGDGFRKIVCIISRASGANVVAGAIGYAALCSRGDLGEKVNEEYERARMAGLNRILENLTSKVERKDVVQPKSKVTNCEIPGVDILQLEDATELLWSKDIYATSGMGCTGPIIMVNMEDLEKSREFLKEANLL